MSASASGARRADLDALRGGAMLLGIALHAAMPFYAPIWPVSEPTASASSGWDEFANAIHGFRMQLFFLLSGFFSAMLARQRGLPALIRTRSSRVALPLALSVLTIVPLVNQAVAGDALPRLPHLAADLNLHHLWFLWYLCAYVAGLALVLAWHARPGRPPRTSRTSRLAGPGWGRAALVVLATCSVLPQYVMVGAQDRTFGPMLSNTLLPEAAAVSYYALFFAGGALVFAARDRRGEPLIDSLGSSWMVVLPASLAVTLPLALASTYHPGPDARLAAAVLQVGYAWGMVIGLLGLARHVLRADRPAVRYLADASYWMYLIHLPILIATHRVIQGWELPASVKFCTLFTVVTVLALASYHLLVRHTGIGRILHGPRPRAPEHHRPRDRRGSDVAA